MSKFPCDVWMKSELSVVLKATGPRRPSLPGYGSRYRSLVVCQWLHCPFFFHKVIAALVMCLEGERPLQSVNKIWAASVDG